MRKLNSNELQHVYGGGNSYGCGGGTGSRAKSGSKKHGSHAKSGSKKHGSHAKSGSKRRSGHSRHGC